MGFLSAISNLPGSDDGAALGSAILRWSDLFLASGGVINWANGNITLTHAAGTLTLAGGQLLVPQGTTLLPSLADATDPSQGIWFANNQILFSISGVQSFVVGANYFAVRSNTGQYRLGTADDVLFGREAPATLQMGDDAAVPVAQTFKGPDARAGTDTNTVGGRMNWEPGLSTGNAVPAIQAMRGGAATVTSGTGAQTKVDRFIPNAFKVLTNNVATAVLNATIANGSSVGGRIVYTIEVWDGTDNQVETGTVTYSSKNKAGVVTGTVTEVSQQDLDSGTLVTTWAISAANPAVISVNANSSLTPSTGYPRITFSIQNLGQQAIAIQ